MYVLPIEIQGDFKISTKGCIGPVPAFETFKIDVPNVLSAAAFTWDTNGWEESVLAAASPWKILIFTSLNPYNFKCFFKRRICFFGSFLGINLKSIFTNASPGRTVFAPSPA